MGKLPMREPKEDREGALRRAIFEGDEALALERADRFKNWELERVSRSATRLAAAANMGKLVGRLLGRGDARFATPEGHTALMSAAMSGSLQCVDLLIPMSDVEAQDIAGATALDMAAGRGHPGCLARLRRAGASLVAREGGKRRRGAALSAAGGGHAGCLSMALEWLAESRMRPDFAPLLSAAASAGGEDCVRLVLRAAGSSLGEEELAAALESACKGRQGDALAATRLVWGLAPLSEEAIARAMAAARAAGNMEAALFLERASRRSTERFGLDA